MQRDCTNIEKKITNTMSMVGRGREVNMLINFTVL